MSKMKILAIDTSTEDSSVAVFEDGKIVGECTVNQKRTHSETLVPIIKDLLGFLSMNLEDLDLIAVGQGPGSFTGVRIGMTVAKTLAQVLEKDIIGISTLEALAYMGTGDIVVPVVNARGGRVYYSFFDKIGKRLSPDALAFAEDLGEEIKSYDRVQVIGDYDEEIQEDLSLTSVTFAKPVFNKLIARGICYLAYEKYGAGQVDSLMDLRANYVRESQAERDMK